MGAVLALAMTGRGEKNFFRPYRSASVSGQYHYPVDTVDVGDTISWSVLHSLALGDHPRTVLD
jgi:hypothetical protein